MKSMGKVVIINGFPRAGKDSFVLAARAAAPQNIDVYGISTVDRVKELAAEMGWDGEKDEKGRRFLHELKMCWSEYNDGPFESILSKVDFLEGAYSTRGGQQFCLFVHSREPQEVDKFKRVLGDKCSTLLIVRPGIKTFDNPADKGVANYVYDCVVYNHTSKTYEESLKTEAGKFLNRLFNPQ